LNPSPSTARQSSSTQRWLVVTADDFGIGAETSRGILDLAQEGCVTATVLLVNSPYAEDSVAAWKQRGRPVEMGWHPCLTLDRPASRPSLVPSLVDRRGRFHSLRSFLLRLSLGRINPEEIEIEWRAQLARFIDLIGSPPLLVNAHHHLHIFPSVAAALHRVLAENDLRPFVRRVVALPGPASGAWLKQRVLSWFGGRAAAALADHRYPGCDELLGLAAPPTAHNPSYVPAAISAASSRTVELTCHPGHADPQLIGRDEVLFRTQERDRLRSPEFRRAVDAVGFRLVPPSYVSNECTAVRKAA